MSRASRVQVLRAHFLVLFASLFAALSLTARGQTPPPADRVPRFASLRSDDVNMRLGPGENYPIEWVLKRKEMPIEIVEQFQNWRKIRDWQGDKGWVLDRMITSKRAVIVEGTVLALYRQPDPASNVVARAEPGVIARLLDCQGPWCRIEAGGYSGWTQRNGVWGVYPDETLH